MVGQGQHRCLQVPRRCQMARAQKLLPPPLGPLHSLPCPPQEMEKARAGSETFEQEGGLQAWETGGAGTWRQEDQGCRTRRETGREAGWRLLSQHIKRFACTEQQTRGRSRGRASNQRKGWTGKPYLGQQNQLGQRLQAPSQQQIKHPDDQTGRERQAGEALRPCRQSPTRHRDQVGY